MLTLTAKAVHRSGEHSEVQETFSTGGGSIGRQPECDMVLPDPDRRISRLQARILFSDGRYVVCNASTSNPMYVNGVELSPGSSQAIDDGDELRAGSYVMAASMTAHAPQPAPLLPGEREAVSAPADAVSQVTPSQQESASSAADPLLALGSGFQGSVNPFADLLRQAAPINGTPATGSNAKNTALPRPSAANDLPDKETSEQSPPARLDASKPVQTPMESPQAKPEKPSDTTVTDDSVNSLNAPSKLLLAGNFDPNGPFGDLLTQKIPADAAKAASAPGAASDTAPPLSEQDMVASAAIWQPGHAARSSQAASDAPQPEASSTLENLLERPSAPETPRRPRSLEDLGEAALPGLAGNPFADLMGASIEEHIAHAPPFDRALGRNEVIPDDFNPLAFGGVAQRNSSDPLTPMGRNAKGLADVVPKKTIDSVYNPGNESPTLLVVDPLDPAQQRLLKVEQSTDPLKIFANDGKTLIPEDLGAKTNGSTRDDAREMVAYFRAPVPKVDSDMSPEAARDVRAAAPTPEPDSPPPDEPAFAELPADFLTSVAPSNMAMPSTANQESNPPPALPPVVDLSGASAGSDAEPEQDSAQTQTRQPDADPGPDFSAAPKPAAAQPSVGDLPETGGTSGSSQTEELMAAFKRGAGLQEWSATSLTPEMMETLGRLLQTAIQGAVSLLAARAAIKQEIHLAVTLINPKSNNPLKFLPDGHTAMLQMFGPKMPGFMTPADAMQEAFNDLLIHQAAIAAGTQATIEALFRRFNPQLIESRYPRTGVGEKLSQSVHYAKLWNMYVNEYHAIREEIKDDFFNRLGSEFHDAYNREYGDRGGNE